MAADERWYFTKEQLQCTPTRKCGVDADKELSYRQQAANFIQDMGQRLPVNQLCINTAIVYMHRFYMFHSFTKFHRNAISACALFLAAKVEEQPRKLEHVIKVAHICLQFEGPLDTKSEGYLEQAQQLVMNENIMLQTLGFDVAIDHPHTHIVKCCQLVRASKDLAQTSYIMATNSLHLTTMCLQCKPTVVACVCIHLACKWASWEIPHSSEGKEWYWYVEKYITSEMLEELTTDFLAILEKYPSRLKKGLKRELEAVNNERKGKCDGSLASLHLMPSLNTERTRSPVPPTKQRPDKTAKTDSVLQQQHDRSHKIKPDKFDKLDRHDRKADKVEKDKHERTFKQLDKPHVKVDKPEHRPEPPPLVDKGRDFKEAKPEAFLNAIGSNSNSQQGYMAASVDKHSARVSGQASTVDNKPALLPTPLSASVDDLGSHSSVNKKHRHAGANYTNARDHKDRRDKELGQSATNVSISSKPSPLVQPSGTQYDRIRHRKEENQSLKPTADPSLLINNHTDTTHPGSYRTSAVPSSAVAPAYLQDNVKENVTRAQSSHSLEHKQPHPTDAKLRSKHASPKIKAKAVPQAKMDLVPANEDALMQCSVNEMRPPKSMRNEQMTKNELSAFKVDANSAATSIQGRYENHDKSVKEAPMQLTKDSVSKTRDASLAVAGLTHSSFANQQMIDTAGDRLLVSAPPVEKRKEKHKHKSREKEKKERHEANSHEHQEMAKMPPPSDQRIKLTISKDLLNSSHVEVPDKKVGNSAKDPIKLKIPKEKLSPAVFKKHEAGDILKLKIKFSKESISVPAKKSESKKRERSPRDASAKSSPKSPKVPRIETRSSRKDDSGVVPHASLLPLPQTSGGCQARNEAGSSKANGNNAQFSGGAYSNYSRKGSTVKSDYKNKVNAMAPYQQPMTAGPYPYASYYACGPSMQPNYFPNAADYYFNPGYHQGPGLMPAPHDQGVPPLPREPPPSNPPPPPE